MNRLLMNITDHRVANCSVSALCAIKQALGRFQFPAFSIKHNESGHDHGIPEKERLIPEFIVNPLTEHKVGALRARSECVGIAHHIRSQRGMPPLDALKELNRTLKPLVEDKRVHHLSDCNDGHCFIANRIKQSLRSLNIAKMAMAINQSKHYVW